MLSFHITRIQDNLYIGKGNNSSGTFIYYGNTLSIQLNITNFLNDQWPQNYVTEL